MLWLLCLYRKMIQRQIFALRWTFWNAVRHSTPPVEFGLHLVHLKSFCRGAAVPRACVPPHTRAVGRRRERAAVAACQITTAVTETRRTSPRLWTHKSHADPRWTYLNVTFRGSGDSYPTRGPSFEQLNTGKSFFCLFVFLRSAEVQSRTKSFCRQSDFHCVRFLRDESGGKSLFCRLSAI